MSTHLTHDAAENRVDYGFFVHLAVFVVVGAVMLAINFNNNPDSYWSYWAVGGWGLGIVLHALCAYVIPGARDRMIDRTQDRMARREERQERREDRRMERGAGL